MSGARLAVSIAGAFLSVGAFYIAPAVWLASAPFLNTSRAVGLIFGVVVLVWHERSVKEAVNVRNVAFLVVSTLIWILVDRLITDINTASIIYLFGTEKGDIDFDVVLYGSVVLGTALLTIAHARFLGASTRRVMLSIPIIFGIWYLSWTYLPAIVGSFGIPVWQGAYLLCMFSPKPGFLRLRRGTVHHART